MLRSLTMGFVSYFPQAQETFFKAFDSTMVCVTVGVAQAVDLANIKSGRK